MDHGPKKKTRDILKTIWEYRIEVFSGLLMFVGIVLSFYYIHIGSGLVGLGFGLCFYEEIHRYFIQLRDVYVEHGVFKSLILIGTIIFFLIAIPLFIIAAAVGYGVMYMINWIAKK